MIEEKYPKLVSFDVVNLQKLENSLIKDVKVLSLVRSLSV